MSWFEFIENKMEIAFVIFFCVPMAIYGLLLLLRICLAGIYWGFWCIRWSADRAMLVLEWILELFEELPDLGEFESRGD